MAGTFTPEPKLDGIKVVLVLPDTKTTSNLKAVTDAGSVEIVLLTPEDRGPSMMGTMRAQDLLPNLGQRLLDIHLAFGESKDWERLAAKQKVWLAKADNDRHFWYGAAEDWLNYIWETLKERAPEGYYFGAQLGDATDCHYGYWATPEKPSEPEPEPPGVPMTEGEAREKFGKYFCRTCMSEGLGRDAAERYSMGVYAGMMCGEHWDKSGYKKDEDFDPSYAGERMDEDY